MHLIGSMGDQGFHLTNQDMANRLGLKYIAITPWWWLSDIVGGWWLKLTEDWGFWGAKCGAVLALGLSGVVTGATLFQLYKPTIPLICAVVLGAFCIPFDMINYYTLPTLLYSLFSFYFLKLHLAPTKTSNPLICGILSVLMVFCRVSLILIVFLPFLSLLLSSWTARRELRAFSFAYLKMFCTIGISFILFALYLHSQDLLSYYAFHDRPSGEHSFVALLTILIQQLTTKTPYMLATAIGGYLFFLAVKHKLLSNRSGALTALSLLLFSILLAIIYISYPPFREFKKIAFHYVWPDNFDVFPILISINIAAVYLLRKTISFQELLLLLLAISWPLLRGAGSTNGIILGIVLSYLLCGLSAALLYRVSCEYQCKVPLFCLGAFLFLLFGSRGFKQNFHLSQPTDFHLARLEGISSSPEKAENLRTLIEEIKRHTKKGDRILACPHIQIAYYASNTLPLGNTVDIFVFSLEQLARKLDQIEKLSPPVLIAKPIIDLDHPEILQANFEWPTTPKFLDEMRQKLLLFDQTMTNKWNMKRTWSNNHFEIFMAESKK